MPVRRNRIGGFTRRRLLRGPLMQGRPGVPHVVQQALQRAHQLMVSGDYDAALALYQRLAAEAYERRRFRAGAQMELESARIHLMLQRADAAKDSAFHALETLLNANIVPGIIMPIMDRIYQALKVSGEEQVAETFLANIQQLLSAHGISPDELRQPRDGTGNQLNDARKLPELCPSCSAPVHVDTVVWTESGRTQCNYCGRPITVE